MFKRFIQRHYIKEIGLKKHFIFGNVIDAFKLQPYHNIELLLF